MDRKIINDLKNAYKVKPSEKKNVFIKSIKKNDMTIFKFIFEQTKYLHNFVLIRCLLLSLVLTTALIVSNSEDLLVIYSSAIPFIVLLMVSELESSKIYKMEELESVTKFSLKMIVFARLFIIGVVSLVMVTISLIVTYKTKNIELNKTLIMFYLPYFITVYGSLCILRKAKEGTIRYCFIYTSLVSLFFISLRLLPKISCMLFETNVGVMVLILIVIMCLLESKKYITKMEEYSWN